MGNQIVIPSMSDWYSDPLKRNGIRLNQILDSGTFFMTLDCTNSNGEPLIVRAYQYNQNLDNFPICDLSKIYFNNLLEKSHKLIGIVPYHPIIVEKNVALLVRSKFEFTLAQRLDEYPYLQPIEKKWIAYQIIRQVAALHENEMVHGCINQNNIFITWDCRVYLGDEAPFKPSQIRADRADLFHHFYRTCCHAPEQLIDSNEDDYLRYNCFKYSMDLFSVGCVLYYLFTSKNLFSLADLQKYHDKEFDLQSKIQEVPEELQPLLTKLLGFDTDERIAAEHSYFQYFPSQFDQISRQFDDFHISDTDIRHLISLESTFTFLADQLPNDARIIFANLFNYYLSCSNNADDYAAFIPYYCKFMSPLSSEIILGRIITNLTPLLALPSTILKTTVLQGIYDLLKHVDHISEEHTGYFSGYLIPLISRSRLTNSLQYRHSLASLCPLIVREIYRIDPSSAPSLSILFTFILQETDSSVLKSFASSIRGLVGIPFSLFEVFMATISSTLNRQDAEYITEIMQVIPLFYEKCQPKDEANYRECLAALWPAILGYAITETRPRPLAAYALFVDWYINKNFSDSLFYSELFEFLNKLSKYELPELKYLLSHTEKNLPPELKQSVLPRFLFRLTANTSRVSATRSPMKRLKKPLSVSISPLLIKLGIDLKPRFLQSMRTSTHAITAISPNYGSDIIGLVTTSDGMLHTIVQKPDCWETQPWKAINTTSMCGSLVGTNRSIQQIDWPTKCTISEFGISNASSITMLNPSTYVVTKDNSIYILDIRTGKIPQSIDFTSQLHASASCIWQDGIGTGIAFKEGGVCILDTRQFRPVSFTRTPTASNLLPLAGKGWSFAVVAPDSVTCYDTGTIGLTMVFETKGARAAPLDGGLVIVDQKNGYFIDTLDVSKCVTLHDRRKISPLQIDSEDIIRIRPKKNYSGTSVHCHAAPIRAVSHTKDIFFSGDANGFLHAWTVVNWQ